MKSYTELKFNDFQHFNRKNNIFPIVTKGNILQNIFTFHNIFSNSQNKFSYTTVLRNWNILEFLVAAKKKKTLKFVIVLIPWRHNSWMFNFWEFWKGTINSKKN